MAPFIPSVPIPSPLHHPTPTLPITTKTFVWHMLMGHLSSKVCLGVGMF